MSAMPDPTETPVAKTTPMRLLTVPARQGFAWVRQGLRLYLQRAMSFTLLLFAFLFAALLALIIPGIGLLLVLMALPLLSLGFMIASRRALAGLPFGPAVLGEGLRGLPHRRRAMLGLLAVYAVATLGVMLLSDAVDGGRFAALQRAMTGDQATDAAAIAQMLADPQLLWGMLLRIGLSTLVSLPFWHAPALVLWQAHGVGQALFISTLACWRNRAAMATYGLGWLALLMAFSVLANLLVLLLNDPRVLALLALPAGLMVTTAFYASLYAIFADCFGQEEPPRPAPEVDARP